MLRDLNPEQSNALCLSFATDETILRRCDSVAMLGAREGSEASYATDCESLRDACIASRDDGAIDHECEQFPGPLSDACDVTVGEYEACLAALPAPATQPGCAMSYSDAKSYRVGPPPDTSGLPACSELNACYQIDM